MSHHVQRFVVARKWRRCGDCGKVIAAGDRYLRYTATPGSEFNDSDKWLHVGFCGGCSQNAVEFPPRDVKDTDHA